MTTLMTMWRSVSDRPALCGYFSELLERFAFYNNATTGGILPSSAAIGRCHCPDENTAVEVTGGIH